MMLGGLIAGCSLSMPLYGDRERLSLTCIPVPSPAKVQMEVEYSGHNKQNNRPPEASAVFCIARKVNMRAGGDMLTLRDLWPQMFAFFNSKA